MGHHSIKDEVDGVPTRQQQQQWRAQASRWLAFQLSFPCSIDSMQHNTLSLSLSLVDFFDLKCFIHLSLCLYVPSVCFFIFGLTCDVSLARGYRLCELTPRTTLCFMNDQSYTMQNPGSCLCCKSTNIGESMLDQLWSKFWLKVLAFWAQNVGSCLNVSRSIIANCQGTERKNIQQNLVTFFDFYLNFVYFF